MSEIVIPTVICQIFKCFKCEWRVAYVYFNIFAIVVIIISFAHCNKSVF